MAEENTYELKSHWNDTVYTIVLRKTYYANNNALAIVALDLSEGYEQPYATLTVNLPESDYLEWNEAYIDTNNLGEEISQWLEENNIAYDLGLKARSGYCEYPLFRFTDTFLNSTKEN